MTDLTADQLAEKSGHEDCLKAIDDFFAEQSLASAGHQPSSEHAASAAVDHPGNFAVAVSVTDYKIFKRKFSMLCTRGHPYKLTKAFCYTGCRSQFFSQRIVNVWNFLPHTVDFTSLVSLKRTIA